MRELVENLSVFLLQATPGATSPFSQMTSTQSHNSEHTFLEENVSQWKLVEVWKCTDWPTHKPIDRATFGALTPSKLYFSDTNIYDIDRLAVHYQTLKYWSRSYGKQTSLFWTIFRTELDCLWHFAALKWLIWPYLETWNIILYNQTLWCTSLICKVNTVWLISHCHVCWMRSLLASLSCDQCSNKMKLCGLCSVTYHLLLFLSKG